MLTTINISLPKDMYEDLRKTTVTKRYSSISEAVRDAVRKLLYQEELTENGFTVDFENAVLESTKEPLGKFVTLKNDKDIEKFFKDLKS